MTDKNPLLALIKKIAIVPDEKGLPAMLGRLKPGVIKKPVRVAFVNAHGVNLAMKDSRFAQDLLDADYVFRDGSGMKILYSMLGREPGLNLNGTDLIPKIIENYAGHEAALLGTADPWLNKAARAIQRKGLRPVLCADGFQEEQYYLDLIRQNPASLIILAMGMPKQERVARLLAENLGYPCLIVCGGAILDFMGGKVPRAPVVFRRTGMEWLYRLLREPKRLFRRYIIGNFVFLVRGLNFTLRSRRRI